MKGEEFLKNMDRLDDSLIQSAANANGNGKKYLFIGLVAAVLAALTVTAVAVGIAMKGGADTPPAPVIDAQTDANETTTTPVETEETVVPSKENSADYVVLKDVPNDTEISGKLSNGIYILPYDIVDIKENETITVYKSKENPNSDSYEYGCNFVPSKDMIGKRHTGINEVGIEVKVNIQDYSNKWITYIVPSETIELLSPESNCFYFESEKSNNEFDSQFIDITYTYKDKATNGYINVYVFAGDFRVEYFNNHYKDGKIALKDEALPFDIKQTYDNFLDIGVACVKGYDYNVMGHVDEIYRRVAIYYGDVDENGIPLYNSNPYLEDYYDNPICAGKRFREEAHEKAQAREKETE